MCEERPIYGGQGRYEPGYDEPGFIGQPVCLWGDPKYGLAPPPQLNGVRLRTVHVSNATFGHHGEMAHPQAYFIH